MKTVYLIPGQGSDYRIFNKLKLDKYYDTVHVKYLIPHRDESLPQYASRIAQKIDTSKSFCIIGVSFGGMVAVELAGIVNPEKVIIISSAKSKNELPKRYTFMHWLPIYKLVPSIFYKYGSYIAQPLVEPDRKKEKATFISMLHDKDPVFLKRVTAMIINWNRLQTPDIVKHIHGTKDHTLPIKNVKPDICINKGSHMMTLTRANEINAEIIKLLSQ